MPLPQITTQRIEGKKNITIHYVTRKPGQTLDLPPSLLFDSQIQNNTVKEIYLMPPYLHPQLTITYQKSQYLEKAKEYSDKHSLDHTHPTGTVLVSNEQILTKAANGSNYHKQHSCKRQELKIPSGQGYELCEGCHPRNHSEVRAIQQLSEQQKMSDITAYLWGHWWCCEYCSDILARHDITNIILSKSWTQTFADIDTSFLPGKSL